MAFELPHHVNIYSEVSVINGSKSIIVGDPSLCCSPRQPSTAWVLGAPAPVFIPSYAVSMANKCCGCAPFQMPLGAKRYAARNVEPQSKGATAADVHESDVLLFEFGLVADVQYGNRQTRTIAKKGSPHALVRRKAWRESASKLSQAVRTWNSNDRLQFVVSLGDIIEGNENGDEARSMRDLSVIMKRLRSLRVPMYHLIGNHCRSISEKRLLPLLKLSRSYYDFVPAKGWRIVCLDTSELCGSAVDANEATKVTLAKLAILNDRPSHHYHGATSKEQLQWLADVLQKAAEAEERVLIMTHYPLLEGSARDSHIAVNNKEILSVIEKEGSTVDVVFAGHDHNGGFATSSTKDCPVTTTHITLPAVLEAPKNGNAFATVSVYASGAIEIHGYGTVPCYSITPPPSSQSENSTT